MVTRSFVTRFLVEECGANVVPVAVRESWVQVVGGIEELAENWVSEENFPTQFGSASDYARKMAKRPLSYFRHRVQNLNLSGQRVLDAGCGSGNFSFGLVPQFDEIYGIDYVRERADLCGHLAQRYSIEGCHFNEGNILDTGFEDSFFDAVFCFGVIIVPQTPLKDALEEFQRIVKPGGEIYVCLNALGWARYLASSDVETRSALGKKGIYVRLRSQLAQIPELLATDVEKREMINAAAEGGHSAVLSSVENIFGSEFAVANTFDQVRNECGDDFTEKLADEFRRISSGDLKGFEALSGYPSTYEPDETKQIAEDLGLEEFVWGTEGSIVRAASPVDVKPIYAGVFEGQTANWEFLVRRPK